MCKCVEKGAKTLSITLFIVTTLIVTIKNATFSITSVVTVILGVANKPIMLSVVMLIVEALPKVIMRLCTK